MILGAFRTILLSKTVITDIVSQRIYPYALPMGEPVPSIDLRVVTGQGFGILGGTSGMMSSNLAIDCYSKSVKEADQIALEIIRPTNGIIGYRGMVGDIFISDIQINDAPTNDQDGVDPGSEEFRYVTNISVDISWVIPCRPN